MSCKHCHKPNRLCLYCKWCTSCHHLRNHHFLKNESDTLRRKTHAIDTPKICKRCSHHSSHICKCGECIHCHPEKISYSDTRGFPQHFFSDIKNPEENVIRYISKTERREMHYRVLLNAGIVKKRVRFHLSSD